MKTKDVLVNFTGGRLKEIFTLCTEKTIATVFEARIRADKPLCLRTDNDEIFLSPSGKPCDTENAYKPSLKDISDCIEIMSNYSLYAFQEEIRNGFITLRGGHRVGVSGRAVFENGSVKVFKGINGLNVRITRQVHGCASPILHLLNNPVFNTLIISPPCRGKTTMLRDLIRQLSDSGLNVGIVDERSEIAGTYMGTIQNDVGLRTDVLDGCPKTEGMFILLRSMSPDIIAIDEIGAAEAKAAAEITNSGVKLLCTAHASSVEEIAKNPALKTAVDNKLFGRYVMLSSNGKMGKIEGVYDENMQRMVLWNSH